MTSVPEAVKRKITGVPDFRVVWCGNYIKERFQNGGTIGLMEKESVIDVL